MARSVDREIKYRQLNLGPFPAPIIDGLTMFADRADLSRAQLARRILTGWVAAQLEADADAVPAVGVDAELQGAAVHE